MIALVKLEKHANMNSTKNNTSDDQKEQQGDGYALHVEINNKSMPQEEGKLIASSREIRPDRKIQNSIYVSSARTDTWIAVGENDI